MIKSGQIAYAGLVKREIISIFKRNYQLTVIIVWTRPYALLNRYHSFVAAPVFPTPMAEIMKMLEKV
jgi:hypothetical protein